MFKRTMLTASALTFAAASSAFAASQAVVATDLNLRAGPGPNYVIEGVMPAEATVDLIGCIDGGAWCEVTYGDQTGWAYAPYLAVTEEETFVAVTEVTTVETVSYEDNGGDALIGGAFGAGIGSAVIGGPAAIAGGVLIGSLIGSTADPDVETITYVSQNPVDPIFIQGEPIVGAVIPAEVELATVPDTTYLYTNLNGQPVLVEAENREIVYIVR